MLFKTLIEDLGGIHTSKDNPIPVDNVDLLLYVPNNFTDEEQEQTRRENEWADE
jgi:hypothetical protein